MKYKCTDCNDTGIIKYKPIDGLTMYSWIPWETRPCKCKQHINNKQSEPQVSG